VTNGEASAATRWSFAMMERPSGMLQPVPTEPGFVLNEICLLRLRTLLAQAESDDVTYREHRDRYRKRANELGFEGHMAWAAEMV
jgi:adenylate cyclase